MLHLHLIGKGAALPHQQPFPGWVKMAVGRSGEPLLLYGGNSHLERGEKDFPFGGSSPLLRKFLCGLLGTCSLFSESSYWGLSGNSFLTCEEISTTNARKKLPHFKGNFPKKY